MNNNPFYEPLKEAFAKYNNYYKDVPRETTREMCSKSSEGDYKPSLHVPTKHIVVIEDVKWWDYRNEGVIYPYSNSKGIELLDGYKDYKGLNLRRFVNKPAMTMTLEWEE